jgi:hypothetical protein
MTYADDPSEYPNIFRQLEESEAFFTEFVGNHFSAAPDELQSLAKCSVTIDQARLSYAYDQYIQGIGRFAVILESGDPDHFKRAGALLHAIYSSQPITGICFDPELEDIDTNSTPIGITYHDAEDALFFARFFNEYHNEFLGFQLAFEICRMYVPGTPQTVDFEYVYTVCVYLKNDGNLSVESLFMIFKSLLR